MDEKILKQLVRDRFTHQLASRPGGASDRESVQSTLDRLFVELAREGIHIPGELRDRLAFEVFQDTFDFGAIDELMRDPSVSEIMVNGPHHIFIERNGQREALNLIFEDERALRQVIERMLEMSPGKRLDAAMPLVDLSLPDGARVHAAIPPVVAGGTHLTVRKYLRPLKDLADYVEQGGMDDRMATFLHACVQARFNILISGATGTGKTTLLEVLSAYCDSDERIVVIEDTMELHFHQADVVRLLTRGPNIEGKGMITITDLFRTSLRMHPNRIMLGEIRGGEVLDYLNALNSGHRGSFGVIHAASPQEAIDRLENLAPYAGFNIPATLIRRQVAHGLDLIVQIEQLPDGSRKITRITEVGDANDSSVQLNDIFVYQAEARERDRVVGKYIATGYVPKFHPQFALCGTPIPDSVYA